LPSPGFSPHPRPACHLILRLTLVLATVTAAAVLGTAPADASRAEWDRLATDIARPWPATQTSEGNFPDYTDGLTPRSETNGPGTRYGDAVLGLALVQHGLRRGNQRFIDAGIQAVTWAVRYDRRGLQQKKPSVFESYAVAAAYNLVRRRIPRHPTFVRTRRSWVEYMRHIRPVSTILRTPNTRRFSNHYLIEALSVLELRRTGVRASSRLALLGPGFPRAVRIFRRMINVGIPRAARTRGQRRRGLPTFLISDPPDYPLAYQGLAMGFYAQAVRLLGGRASRAARSTLRRAANASWLLAAPDGATGYFGRSMEESWAQSGTALGAEVAAQRGRASGTERARYRALAHSALARLRDAYGDGPRGYAFIPALRLHGALGARALEPYAGAPSFAGLTLLNLNWLLEEMPADPPRSALFSAREGGTKLSRRRSEFAVARAGRNWFAVRAGQSLSRHPEDLRYDFGLIALKRGGFGSPWRDLIPLRPLTHGRRDSAGPILYRGRAKGYPWGRRFSIRRGRITLSGGFRTSSGQWLRHHVRFRFVPTSCGVQVTWGGRRGDRFEYSSFVRGFEQTPAISRERLADSAQEITPSPRPGAVRVDGRRYYSASDPQLRRVRMRWRLRGPRRISVTTCRAP
jgi:hypothetical protein